ncbi:hypothetical protein ACOMHN_056469 [Nucella lapillus]
MHQRRKSTTKTTLLTGQQRLIVIRTWHKLSADISTLGISIMTRLVDKYPRVAPLFPFETTSTAQLQLDPKFRQHAFWLIQSVSAMVENMNDLDLMVADMFVEIGEKHAAIPNFSADLFRLLPATWCYVWEDNLRDRYTTQTDKSWGKIFKYMVEKLEEGCTVMVLDEIPTFTSVISTSTPNTSPPSSNVDYSSTASSTTIVVDADSSSDSDDSDMMASSMSIPNITLAKQESPVLRAQGAAMAAGKKEDTPHKLSRLSFSRQHHRESSHKHSSTSKAELSELSTPQKTSNRKTSEPTPQQEWTSASVSERLSHASITSEPLPDKTLDDGAAGKRPTSPPSKQLPPLEEPFPPSTPKAC